MVVISYRCVCGETISLDSEDGGKCADCGRNYTSAVFQHSVAQTVSFNNLSTDSTTDLTLPSVAHGADDDTRIGQTLGHYKIES